MSTAGEHEGLVEETAEDREQLDMALFSRAIELKATIKAGEKELKEMKNELKAVEEQLLFIFENSQLDRITQNNTTVYPSLTIRASAKAEKMPEVCRILREMGYGNAVKETVNANTLSSIIRSFLYDDDEREVPADLEDVVNIMKDWRVGYRVNN